MRHQQFSFCFIFFLFNFNFIENPSKNQFDTSFIKTESNWNSDFGKDILNYIQKNNMTLSDIKLWKFHWTEYLIWIRYQSLNRLYQKCDFF